MFTHLFKKNKNIVLFIFAKGLVRNIFYLYSCYLTVLVCFIWNIFSRKTYNKNSKEQSREELNRFHSLYYLFDPDRYNCNKANWHWVKNAKFGGNKFKKLQFIFFLKKKKAASYRLWTSKFANLCPLAPFLCFTIFFWF